MNRIDEIEQHEETYKKGLIGRVSADSDPSNLRVKENYSDKSGIGTIPIHLSRARASK